MVNEWTRDDLPAVMDLVKASVDAVATDPSGGAYAALDAVVDHLNEHHPKPDAQADAEWLDRALNTPDEQLVALDEARIEANIQRNRAVRERDVFAHRLENQSETIAEMQGVIKGLHRAHEIVEGERDQARRERDAAVRRAEDLRFSRDEARRAEDEWERERDQAVEACALFQRDVHEWRERAEAAEARTTPTVSRADIEKAVRRGHNMLNAEVGVVNEMCDLLGIGKAAGIDPDPVEVAIRDGLTVWGVTDKAVQEIAASVRHVLGQEAKR